MENAPVIKLKSSDASKSGEQLKMSSPKSPPEPETEQKETLIEEGSATATETVGQVATRMIHETVKSSLINQERLKDVIDETKDKMTVYVKMDKCQDLTSPEVRIDRSLELLNSVVAVMEDGERSILEMQQKHKQMLTGACGIGQEDIEVQIDKSESVVTITSADEHSDVEVETEPRTSKRVRKSGGSFLCSGCLRTIWGTKEAMEHQRGCKVKDAKVRSSVFPHEYVTDIEQDVAIISD